MEDGYVRGGYPIGRVGMLGMSIQEGGTQVFKREDGYARAADIQKGEWVYWGSSIQEGGDRWVWKVGMLRRAGIQEGGWVCQGGWVSKKVHWGPCIQEGWQLYKNEGLGWYPRGEGMIHVIDIPTASNLRYSTDPPHIDT